MLSVIKEGCVSKYLCTETVRRKTQSLSHNFIGFQIWCGGPNGDVADFFQNLILPLVILCVIVVVVWNCVLTCLRH